MKYLNTDTGELLDFEWRTPYSHDNDQVSRDTGLTCKDPSLAQQHEKEAADINTIVRNFGVTGTLPQIPLPPALDDFADIFDFQSAMNVQAQARASFMALPAEVREAFYNDPHNFVSQIDAMLTEKDPDQRERNLRDLRLLGLAVEPGPKADKTTLGDILSVLKERSTAPEPSPTGGGSRTA